MAATGIRINYDRLLKKLTAFYRLTGIPVSFYDTDYVEHRNPEAELSPICRIIRRSCADCCRRCDLDAMREAAAGQKLVSYHCHAGLREMVLPVRFNDETVGFLMFGQMIDRSSSRDVKCRLLHSYMQNADSPKEMRHALHEAKVFSEDQQEAIAFLGRDLAENDIFTVEKDAMIQGIDRYIDNHLDTPFTLQDLCRGLGVSRSSLYNYTKEKLSLPIGTYIRQRRMQRAGQLLHNTSLPVEEVARQTGFTDYDYFLRCFHKAYGMSCRQYRKII